ncbi:uncharacterized protein LOC110863471 isoform X3 [Folsomia candida]|uniref:uncharacterized protein LOC110863471 isoform X3 n=1 Tax=Folsomia candida TaxID=158441 RepID=UPI0016055310|nr:uncharacterized protein LOC110863471 isoform X3 [Folsomia candida]
MVTSNHVLLEGRKSAGHNVATQTNAEEGGIENIKDRENIILENTEEAIIAFINKLPEQYIQKIAFHPRIINAREQGNGSLGYDMETNKAEKDVGTDGNVVEQTLLLDQIAIKNGGEVKVKYEKKVSTSRLALILSDSMVLSNLCDCTHMSSTLLNYLEIFNIIPGELSERIKREFDPRVKALMLYKFLKTHRTDEDLEKLKVF